MGLWDVASAAVGTGLDLWQQHRQNTRIDNQRKEDAAMQLDFAKNGIRWKVEDAVAAGLHPLAAVGAMGSTYNPPGIATGGISGIGENISSMGQNISRSARVQMTPEERELHDLTIAEMKSRIGETDARRDYYASEAMRNNGPGNAPFPATGKPEPGLISGMPANETSRSKEDSSLVASDQPLWQKTEIAPGIKLDMPYSQGEGPLEQMESWPAWLLAAWKNVIYNPMHSYRGKPLGRAKKDRGYKLPMKDGIWHGN